MHSDCNRMILILILNLHKLMVTIFVPQNGMSNGNEYWVVFDISNLDLLLPWSMLSEWE